MTLPIHQLNVNFDVQLRTRLSDGRVTVTHEQVRLPGASQNSADNVIGRDENGARTGSTTTSSAGRSTQPPRATRGTKRVAAPVAHVPFVGAFTQEMDMERRRPENQAKTRELAPASIRLFLCGIDTDTIVEVLEGLRLSDEVRLVTSLEVSSDSVFNINVKFFLYALIQKRASI